MGRRVLLLSVNRCLTPDPVFPLGLAHLGAALRAAGHETCWFDVQDTGRTIESVVAEFRPHVVGLSIRNIDDVLIRRQETFFDDAAGLIRRIRAVNRCPVVVGGSGFSIFPERLLELSGADYGIRGEGEAGLPALVEALAAEGPLDSVPGLVYRRNGKVVTNAPEGSPLNGPLEAEDRPLPVVRHYLAAGGMLNVQTQRGCAHTCCYCTYPLIEGRRHRRRAPEAVAEELARLEAEGVRYVFVVDSIFNSSERHVVETCEAIRRRGLRMRWGCFLRPQGLSPELLQLMRAAGLEHVEFGSDSFSDAVLVEYSKRLEFADILASHQAARAAGVETCHFLICGGPGESLATLDEGFQRSRLLEGAVVFAMVGMRVYPGTPLAERALREGRITPETDLLPPVYYLAPGLTTETVFARLEDYARRSCQWIVGEPGPELGRFVQRLRQRGVVGPLWTYFSLLQRFRPETSSTAPNHRPA